MQYVDDLLLAASDLTTSLGATFTVLEYLNKCGFKVAREKLQVGRATVDFLGRRVTATGHAPHPTHTNSILDHSKPNTVKDMSFLGLANFSWTFIPDFSETTSHMR